MKVPDRIAELKALAVRARRLSLVAPDRKTTEILEASADECEVEAARLEALSDDQPIS